MEPFSALVELASHTRHVPVSLLCCASSAWENLLLVLHHSLLHPLPHCLRCCFTFCCARGAVVLPPPHPPTHPPAQELSLDTAFLPELRELVYAAARGNIPTSGPGALTGLCLLDQAVSSPLQLASLSQLSSLAGVDQFTHTPFTPLKPETLEPQHPKTLSLC